MQQKECPGCAVQMDSKANICPICGYEFPRQPLSTKIVTWTLIVLLIFWLVL